MTKRESQALEYANEAKSSGVVVELTKSKVLQKFIAGFDLAAQRKKDGLLYSYTDPTAEPLEDWPNEIKLFGLVFEKEEVVKGKDGYESAIYV
jgi:hypothetical protein